MEIAKYRKEGCSGEWYLTDFTMKQVEGRLRFLEEVLEVSNNPGIERELYKIKPTDFSYGDPRCRAFHSGDCIVTDDDPDFSCVGIEQCTEAEPITNLALRAIETEAIFVDWVHKCRIILKIEKLLKRARDALCLLEKDEDRGITKEEKKLVEEIDTYFGVLTPEHQGKKTFRLTEK